MCSLNEGTHLLFFSRPLLIGILMIQFYWKKKNYWKTNALVVVSIYSCSSGKSFKQQFKLYRKSTDVSVS